jgi:hypothetical protein
MPEQPRGIIWEAYEHHHLEKKSDWFWILGIITITSAVVSILLGNTLLGILILIAGALVAILASREPKIISYAVTQRGLRIDEKLFPYTTLEAFCIDEEGTFGPQLLVRSEKMFMPLLILPLPEDAMDDIEDIIAERLAEEHIEEPLAHKLLEFFGF